MAAYKLDIFDTLSKIDNKKTGNLYAKLSEDERKGFAPLIVMRWMTGTSDERQIMLLNEFVNPYVFPLAKHPELLMQLLQVSSSKMPRRYSWLGVKSKKKKAEAWRVVSEYFDLSDREVALIKPFPSDEEVLSMADDLGWQPDEVKKLQAECKACKG
jgi:hypothetical protein